MFHLSEEVQYYCSAVKKCLIFQSRTELSVMHVVSGEVSDVVSIQLL